MTDRAGGGSTLAAPTRSGVLFLAIGVFAVSFIRYALLLDSPLGTGQDGVFTAVFAGYLKNYDFYGFARLRGAPVYFFLPLKAPDAHLYVNHPPVFFWIQYAIDRLAGVSEWSLRLFPAIAASLTNALVAAVVRRRSTTLAALVCAAFLLVDRMTFFFGWMAGYESTVLCLMTATLLAYERRRSGVGPAWPIAAFAAAAVMIDWAGAFVVPALLVVESLRARDERRWRDFLWPCVAVGMVVIADLLWVTWVKGGFGSAIAAMRAAAGDANTFAGSREASFLGTQWRMLRIGHGLPVLVAGVAAAIVLLGHGMRTVFARAIVFFVVPAALNVIAFRSRAYDHEFWLYYSTPVTAVALGGAAASLFFGSLARRVAVAAAGLALLAAAGFHSIEHRRETKNAVDSAFLDLVNERLGPRDLLIVRDIHHPGLFRARCWPWEYDLEGRPLDDLVTWWRGADLAADRMVVVVWDWQIEKRPALAAEVVHFGPAQRAANAQVLVFTR